MYMNENLVNFMITTLYIIQTFYCRQLICGAMETPKSLVIIDELNLTRCGICQTTKKGVALQCPVSCCKFQTCIQQSCVQITDKGSEINGGFGVRFAI